MRKFPKPSTSPCIILLNIDLRLTLFPLFITEMLTNIFFCLYNNDVISEQGFEAWLACEEPADQQGKGVAIKSTSQFFLWMREKEEDDEIGEGEE